MITITRRVARQLRAVFRPAYLDAPPSRWPPILTFRTHPAGGLRVRFARPEIAVECLVPGPPRPREAVLLPMDMLPKLQAREDSPLTLEADGLETVVLWETNGFPELLRLKVPTSRSLPLFPRLPAHFHPAPDELWHLLAVASSVATDGTIRLEGDTVHGDGFDGAPDSLDDGFRFPWPRAIRVAASPAYGALEQQRGAGLRIARTARHVVLKRGAWCAWLTVLPSVTKPMSPA